MVASVQALRIGHEAFPGADAPIAAARRSPSLMRGIDPIQAIGFRTKSEELSSSANKTATAAESCSAVMSLTNSG